MPVGTQATVKGLTPDQLRATGTRMLLANTYHLALRPGEQVVESLGGLHAFMGWDGPILTDSGGFQVFSLSERNRITDQGVTFRSHLDGRLLELTPERATAIQEALGADVAMCLDHCPPLPASHGRDRRRGSADDRLGDALQGGPRPRRSGTLRDRAGGAACRPARPVRGCPPGPRLRRLRRRRRQRRRGARSSPPGPRRHNPPSAPRPAALPDGRRPPARHRRRRRHRDRSLRLRACRPATVETQLALQKKDTSNFATPFTVSTPDRSKRVASVWPAAGSAARISAICFMAKEMLGPILASIHNLTFLHRLTSRIRAAIAAGRFVQFRLEVLEALGP